MDEVHQVRPACRGGPVLGVSGAGPVRCVEAGRALVWSGRVRPGAGAVRGAGLLPGYGALDGALCVGLPRPSYPAFYPLPERVSQDPFYDMLATRKRRIATLARELSWSEQQVKVN